MSLEVRDVVELIAISMLPISFIGFMTHRIVTKRTIGARAIQFMAVVLLLPVILVLALEKNLGRPDVRHTYRRAHWLLAVWDIKLRTRRR